MVFSLVSNLRGNAIRLQISLVGENYILLFLRIPFLSIILLCVLTMEISIIGSYLLMRFCFEDKVVRNNWRWKCFEMGFSGGVYMELYSLYYIFAVLNIHGFSSILISICYSLIFNVMCGLGLGALSYLTASWFINKIYHQKVNL